MRSKRVLSSGVLIWLVAAGWGSALISGLIVAERLSHIAVIQRLVMPGAGRLTLAGPADYALFYEYRSRINDTTYNAPRDAPVSVSVIRVGGSGGREVALIPWSATRYSVGDHAGRSLAGFRIETTGEYEVRAAYQPPATTPFVVAVLTGMDDLGLTILAGTLTVFGLVLGIACGATLLARRRLHVT